ncbi:hypothetical protein [Chryseobacterium potabilaquae]|uniref:hypothetical protein n=1 Tax=Chryseobacterium potabilaquae TaxID=2675057 RepID=UPI001389BDE5|nr:hypothetical protein [Chryseobacterium potabilaquae]
MSILLVCATSFLCAQEVIWEKDIPSSTQDFLSQITPTIDGQYLITGSSIQTSKLQTVESKQSNSYDFHLVKASSLGKDVVTPIKYKLCHIPITIL